LQQLILTMAHHFISTKKTLLFKEKHFFKHINASITMSYFKERISQHWKQSTKEHWLSGKYIEAMEKILEDNEDDEDRPKSLGLGNEKQ
jgi:predicted transposase YbfD/YdcC